MKSIAVMFTVLFAGDLALFSGDYSTQAWHSTRTQLKSIQAFADEAAESLTRG